MWFPFSHRSSILIQVICVGRVNLIFSLKNFFFLFEGVFVFVYSSSPKNLIINFYWYKLLRYGLWYMICAIAVPPPPIFKIKNDQLREFPRGPVVRDSELSLPRAWVQSLVRKLRSHKLCSAAKKTPSVLNMIKICLFKKKKTKPDYLHKYMTKDTTLCKTEKTFSFFFFLKKHFLFEWQQAQIWA